MKIFLDPGHGGTDPGAISPINNLYESEVNLDIANRVEKILLEKGYDVSKSRNDDTNVRLGTRARLANEFGADYFISIHSNYFDDEQPNGVETFYYKKGTTSEMLSDFILNELAKNTDARNLGSKERDLAVLRLTDMPATLVEVGFLTNPDEAKKLATSEYREIIARSIVGGLEKQISYDSQSTKKD